MIRAVLFDFYGVWTPDVISDYLAEAATQGPAVQGKLEQVVHQYYQGLVSPSDLAQAFRFNLRRPDIDTEEFTLREEYVYGAVTEFMRGLHGHFVKVGILANLGAQEYKLLSDFNAHNQVFEIIASPQSLQANSPLLSEEVFAKALQAIGEPPASCLVVSANPAYLEFAQSLGMAVLPYQGYDAMVPELDRLLSADTAA
jgi:FMN phosphatase YigB (HAD superfamily)